MGGREHIGGVAFWVGKEGPGKSCQKQGQKNRRKNHSLCRERNGPKVTPIKYAEKGSAARTGGFDAVRGSRGKIRCIR